MTSSDYSFGLTKEALQKIDAKYDPEIEKTVMGWIDSILGQKVYTKTGSDGVWESLKDGTVICQVMNRLKPGAIKNINNSTMAFKQMENIGSFLTAAKEYGLADAELFQTVDLFEKGNMTQVIITLMALGRRARKNNFNGPTIGPKEADKNVREFTEEQLKEGQKIIGLQMGSNQGANQSGQIFGKNRSILD